MATKKAATAVVKAQPQAVTVLEERPDYLKDSRGRGQENVGVEDLSIPRLEIIQSTSPIKTKGDPKYVEGATEGQIFNSLTRELLGEEVLVMPVFFRKEWAVWGVREKGKAGTGGFFGSFGTPEEAARKQAEVERETEIIDTPLQFCLLLKPDGGYEEVVVTLTRTKAKVSRRWNSLIRMAGGDRFSRVYTLKTVIEKNDFGTFYNFDVALKGYPPEPLYRKALALYEQVASGARKMAADFSDAEPEDGAQEEF